METKIIKQGINESVEQFNYRINNLLNQHKDKIYKTEYLIQDNLLIFVIEVIL